MHAIAARARKVVFSSVVANNAATVKYKGRKVSNEIYLAQCSKAAVGRAFDCSFPAAWLFEEAIFRNK
jgi:hypothetical protein